jgi:hypothetical protein
MALSSFLSFVLAELVFSRLSSNVIVRFELIVAPAVNGRTFANGRCESNVELLVKILLKPSTFSQAVRHEIDLTPRIEPAGVTNVAGFQQDRRSSLGHASIVDDGSESAVFHLTQSRDSAVAGSLARDQLDR